MTSFPVVDHLDHRQQVIVVGLIATRGPFDLFKSFRGEDMPFLYEAKPKTEASVPEGLGTLLDASYP